ncbi:MAG: flagellar hook-length control protein FliK [Burkholderiales bacterium]|nr:flagellar hook-length control protein FliK [Burkholderiales bacterium]
MSVTASRSPAPIVAPALQAAPTPPDREPASPPASHPFAELLRQNRGADRPPAEPPRAASKDDASESRALANETEGAAEAPPTGDLSTRSDAGRARTRSTANARSGARPTSPAERADRGTVAPRQGHDDDGGGAASDAANAANPAGAARPEALRPIDSEPRVRAASEARQLGEAAAGRADTATSVAGATDSGADAGDARSRRLAGDPAGPADAGRSASRTRDGAGPAEAAPFAQALAEAKEAPDRSPTAAAGERPLPPAFATALAAHEAQPQASPAGDASAPGASLPVPIDSPEFASALGVQVSVFVREGVQHAELHLNPAETGPVSIAITLEGTQARVEFGADLAATRQAIEDGLPALASALRDAGFTLAGGGVAQHSRPGGGQAGDDPAGRGEPGRREGRAGEALAAGVQRTSHRVAAGGLDVYA